MSNAFKGITRRASRRSTGFTIIELLVVIAIIALLVSILMPALGKGREQAKIAKCLANQRELLKYTLMYRQEEPGERMWWYRVPYAPNVGQPTLLTPWVFGGFQAPNPQDDGYTADSEIYPAQVRPLNKFVAPLAQGKEIIELYKCPSDRTWETAVIGQDGPSVGDDQPFSSWQANGSSYTLNTRFMQGYNWPPGNFNFTIQTGPDGNQYSPEHDLWSGKIAKELFGGNTSKFVMWMEQGSYSAFYRAGPTLADSQAGPQRFGWHHQFSYWSAGFGDGHAEYKKMDTRVVHGPNWTLWDPKKPWGGLP